MAARKLPVGVKDVYMYPNQGAVAQDLAGLTRVDRLIEAHRPSEHWDETVARVERGAIREAMISDDLPVLLGGTADLRVREGFLSIPLPWTQCFRTEPFNNFRQHTIASVGALDVDSQIGVAAAGAPDGFMPLVPEGHMYDNARMSEEYEYAQLDTYGCTFFYTRHMVYNDDTRSLNRLPSRMGAAMARTMNYHVGQALEAGASTTVSGMYLRAGTRLFTVAQGNMFSGAHPLTYANLIAMCQNFMLINAVSGDIQGLPPKYLIVPAGLQYQAQYLTSQASTTLIAAEGAAAPAAAYLTPDYNQLAGQLIPVVLRELTSQIDWYLAADYNEYDTLEFGTLDGRLEPEVFSQDMPNLQDADGMQFKIRHDWDVFAPDWRGMLKVDDTTT